MDKLHGIQEAAAVFPANSALGAMFQLHLIADLADQIESCVPEDSQENSECKEWRNAITRMCYSIRDYLSAITGAKAEDACEEYFLPESGNPHRLIEEAVVGKSGADAAA